LKEGLGTDETFVIPLDATLLGRMFTLREIFYNENFAAAILAAIHRRPSKESAAPLKNGVERLKYLQRGPNTSNNDFRVNPWNDPPALSRGPIAAGIPNISAFWIRQNLA